MATPPELLNDDGSASMATALLMTHHAFRRDIARFAEALAKVAAGDVSRVEALRQEWGWYRGALHGHHEMEDSGIFPSLKSEHAELSPIIDGLTAEHRRIDPLLERGDHAFAELPKTEHVRAVVTELAALLDAHLAAEEAGVVQFLRPAKAFPAPEDEQLLEMYAQGFGWTSHGIAPEVLKAVDAMLPAALSSKLPAARAAFDAKCERIWGPVTVTASRTSVPGR
jgi:hemerythrin-like domain-containing protein